MEWGYVVEKDAVQLLVIFLRQLPLTKTPSIQQIRRH